MAAPTRPPARPPFRLSASVVKSLCAPPHSALSSVAIAKEELRNSLIIRPDPAQSCLIKPNAATNDFRSQSHQIKPNQTIEIL